jgi:aspartokinase-like uncharacterized kinase
MIDPRTIRTRPLRVVKVGGSLLDWPPLRETLARWLGEQGDATNVLIAGGGALADAIRRADAAHKLGQERAHALCIDLLAVTARMLAAVLGDQSEAASWCDLHSQQEDPLLPRSWVLDAATFLRNAEAAAWHGDLPHTWDATSDSIAAAAARALVAEELVLLKSCDSPCAAGGEHDFRALADAGYVDRYFPAAAAQFSGRVRLVNLRGAVDGSK